MATPDAQNSEVVNRPSPLAETQPVDNNGGRAWSQHDWFTYALAAATAFTAMGVIFVLWGDKINNLAIVVAGAILFTVATVMWVSFVCFLTVQILRIFLPIGGRWLKHIFLSLRRRLGK